MSAHVPENARSYTLHVMQKRREVCVCHGVRSRVSGTLVCVYRATKQGSGRQPRVLSDTV